MRIIVPKEYPTNLPVVFEPLKTLMANFTSMLLKMAATMTEEATFSFSESNENLAILIVMASVSANPEIRAEK